MRKLLFYTAILVAMFSCRGVSRQVAVDTSKQVLPQLDLPEITIVGKKAVTLPFARKGEMYDVNIYHAPSPDSSLIGWRAEIPITPGSVAKYAERIQPWHFSVDGMAGAYVSGALHGYASYNTIQWQLGGHAGLYFTRGHTTNAASSMGVFDATAQTLLKTDNNILRTLIVSLDAGISQNTYGVFGIPNTKVERTKNNVEIGAHLGSLDRGISAVDFNLRAKIVSLTDKQTSNESHVSSISPEINGAFETRIKNVRIITGLSYVSSSLDYSKPTQSPSVVNFSASGEWHYSDELFFRIGGIFSNGTDNIGQSSALVSPTARIGLNFGSGKELALWWKPEMSLTTFGENLKNNPFLVREFAILPERKTVNVGGTLILNSEKMNVEITAAFSRSKDKGITIADSGNIRLDYVDVSQVMLRLDGMVKPTQQTMVTLSVDLQPSNEKGTSAQLPMTPLFRLQSRGEIELNAPIAVWASVDYWSKQNIDRQGLRQLDAPILVGAGISTTFVKQTLFSLEVSNVLNSGYEWWNGYAAPGRQVIFRAKVNIQ